MAERVDRRTLLVGAAALLVPAGASAQPYGRARLTGDVLDPKGDDSGRIVPAPPKGYWPYAGISGAGRPASSASLGQGWISGMPNVAYTGPDKPRYPFQPLGKRADGLVVRNGLLPPVLPVWHVHNRDPVVQLGPDGWYYMTGSTGDNIWAANDGIELWRSRDLKRWDYRGLIWSIERDGVWEKHWRMRKGVPYRAIWAPEIHHIRGNWYLCHCLSRAGIGVLKSVSRRPEGPYLHAFSPDKPIRSGIDATLFEDDDGSVWLSYGSGSEIVRLEDDLSGLAGEWQEITAADPAVAAKGKNRFGFEGAAMFRRGGRYHLAVCQFVEGRYSFQLWSAERITGPYSGGREVPSCGGGNFFRDKAGDWWVTCFGNDDQSPFREMPALLRVDFDAAGHAVFAGDQPFADAAAYGLG